MPDILKSLPYANICGHEKYYKLSDNTYIKAIFRGNDILKLAEMLVTYLDFFIKIISCIYNIRSIIICLI